MRIAIIIFIMFFGLKSNAQMPKQQWVTIKSVNLKCWECKERLEKYLVVENKANMESGMIQWKINLLQGEIKVQFWPDRTNENTIRIALNNAGFDADEEKAEPEAYKKLPPICKRAEDGGGPLPKKPCHIQPYN
jgi:hypothetical protein